MKDSDLRGKVLKILYENREREMSFGFADGDPIPEGISAKDWIRICKQLDEQNLITWNPLSTFGGIAEINAFGVDVVEGTSTPPIAIHIDQSQRIDVRDSQGVQIAGANSSQQQTIQDAFEHIIQTIESAEIPPAEKQEAKSTLRKLLESKALNAAIGSIATVLLKKYFPGP